MHDSPKHRPAAWRSRPSRFVAIAVAALLGLGACATEPIALHVSDSSHTMPEDASEAPATELVYERLSDPPRTVVKDGSGQVVATFTDGARTVVVTGPERTFEEPTATEATVTTTNWVRLAPREWSKGAEPGGLVRAVVRRRPSEQGEGRAGHRLRVRRRRPGRKEGRPADQGGRLVRAAQQDRVGPARGERLLRLPRNRLGSFPMWGSSVPRRDVTGRSTAPAIGAWSWVTGWA